MIDALTVLLRLFITVLPFAYLVFLVRTSWRTGSKRFSLISTANILICFLVWLSSWLSGVLLERARALYRARAGSCLRRLPLCPRVVAT